MSEVEQAAARLRELAERIVRCTERVDSYAAVLATEERELERLRVEHHDAKKALIQAAQGNVLNCIQGYANP